MADILLDAYGREISSGQGRFDVAIRDLSSAAGENFARGLSETLEAVLRKRGGASVRHIEVSDPYREIPAVYRASNVIKGAFTDGAQELYLRNDKREEADEKQTLPMTGPIGMALELFSNPISVVQEKGPDRTVLSERRFRGTVAIQAVLHKAAYVLAVPGKVTGLPARLIPTIPGTIRPVVARDDSFELLYWEYRQRGMSPIPLRVEDVVAIPFAPDPFDIFGGVAPVTPASDAIDTSKAHTVFRKSAMANSGMQGFVSIDLGDPSANANGLTKEQAAEIKKRLYEENMGSANAEKVALLTGKASFTPVGPSTAREMQLSAGERQSLEDIVRTTGVTPALMGIFDHAALSRATIMIERSLLYHNSVIDFARNYDEELTKIAQRFDPRLYLYTNFDNVDALKEDADSRWNRAGRAIEVGVTRNEANNLFDLGLEESKEKFANTPFLKQGLAPAAQVAAGMVGGGLPMLGLGSAGDSEAEDAPPPEPETAKPIGLDDRREAREIVAQVNSGALPRDSGIALLVAGGMTQEMAEAVIGSAGTEPTTARANEDAAGAAPPARGASPVGPGVARVATTQPLGGATRDQIREAQWRAFDKKIRPFEDKIETKLRKFLNKTRAQILKSLEPTDPKVPADEQVERAVAGLSVPETAAAVARQVEEFYGFDDDLRFRILGPQTAVARGMEDRITRGADDSAGLFSPQSFAELIRSIIQTAFTAGGFGANRELVDIGIVDDSVLEADRDRLPKIASKYFDKRLGMMVSIGDSIKAEVHSTLLEGYKAGESLNKLKDRVRATFKTSLTRARTIARTEAGISVNAGRFEAMKTNNADGENEWLSARDEVVRASHQRIDGERRKTGERFSNGLLYAQDPNGPASETVNCRCTTSPVSTAFEAFEAQTAQAAGVDVASDYVMLRTSAENLARRAVRLGIECPLDTIARHVPAALAENLRRDLGDIANPAEVLRHHVETNPAVSGAVRSLGGTLFVTQWARAFGQDPGRLAA